MELVSYYNNKSERFKLTCTHGGCRQRVIRRLSGRRHVNLVGIYTNICLSVCLLGEGKKGGGKKKETHGEIKINMRNKKKEKLVNK